MLRDRYRNKYIVSDILLFEVYCNNNSNKISLILNHSKKHRCLTRLAYITYTIHIQKHLKNNNIMIYGTNRKIV